MKSGIRIYAVGVEDDSGIECFLEKEGRMII